jgi:hypothetical protein
MAPSSVYKPETGTETGRKVLMHISTRLNTGETESKNKLRREKGNSTNSPRVDSTELFTLEGDSEEKP